MRPQLVAKARKDLVFRAARSGGEGLPKGRTDYVWTGCSSASKPGHEIPRSPAEGAQARDTSHARGLRDPPCPVAASSLYPAFREHRQGAFLRPHDHGIQTEKGQHYQVQFEVQQGHDRRVQTSGIGMGCNCAPCKIVSTWNIQLSELNPATFRTDRSSKSVVLAT